METKNTKSNQEEDEIQRGGVWGNEIMNGTWDGNGYWIKDGTWKGTGTWKGGSLFGTWNAKGDWKPVDINIGTWKGDGEIESNIKFAKNTEKSVAVIGLILNIAVIGLILNGSVVDQFGLITAFMIIVITGLLSIVSISMVQKTRKGKLSLEGTWKDVGESRILDVSGKWKLGIYEGIIKGRMKDPKPN